MVRNSSSYGSKMGYSKENMPNQAEKPNRNGNNATAIKT